MKMASRLKDLSYQERLDQMGLLTLGARKRGDMTDVFSAMWETEKLIERILLFGIETSPGDKKINKIGTKNIYMHRYVESPWEGVLQ